MKILRLILILILVSGVAGQIYANDKFAYTEDDKQCPLDLRTLVDLVISHDPALEGLRGALAEADLKVAIAGRGEAPQLRFGYGEVGDWSTSDPYTETSTETSYDVNTGLPTSTEVTTREVTPGEQGETIHERVTTSGVLTSETIEQQSYGQDVYGGRSSYSIKLRVIPKSPFVSKAAQKQQRSIRSKVEILLEASLVRAALSVEREYNDIQYKIGELKTMQRRAKIFRADLEQLAQLKKVSAISHSDFYKRRTEALIYLSELQDIEAGIEDATRRLRSRAGIDSTFRISFAGNLEPLLIDFDMLDMSSLVKLAQSSSPELLVIRTEKARAEGSIALDKAERIPWLSYISLDYGLDDAANGVERDEWGIYTGVNIPIQAWFDGKSRSARGKHLTSIERQEKLIQRQIELTINDSCQSLKSAQARWSEFSENTKDAKNSIMKQMSTITGDDLTSQRTRWDLNEALIDLDMRRLKTAQQLNCQLFDLCHTLGCELSLLPNK